MLKYISDVFEIELIRLILFGRASECIRRQQSAVCQNRINKKAELGSKTQVAV